MGAQTKLKVDEYVTIGEGDDKIVIRLIGHTHGDMGGIKSILDITAPKHLKFGFPYKRGNDASDQRPNQEEIHQVNPTTEIEKQRQLQALKGYQQDTRPQRPKDCLP